MPEAKKRTGSHCYGADVFPYIRDMRDEVWRAEIERAWRRSFRPCGCCIKNKMVYISGAVSGRNKGATAHKFAQAERYITALGLAPVNPLKNGLPATATWEQHMKKDIALLGTCSRVLMLPDWEESKGARQELKEAIKQNKKITFL